MPTKTTHQNFFLCLCAGFLGAGVPVGVGVGVAPSGVGEGRTRG